MANSGYVLEIQGDKQLLAKFQQADAVAVALLTRAMSNSVGIVWNDAKIYPPTSAANSPPPPYYIRGTGTQYQTGNRGESEQLYDSWVKKIGITAKDALEGVVENVNNSYAVWVHSITRQAWFHKLRGWRNVEQIAENSRMKVEAEFEKAAQLLTRFIGP